MNGPETDAKSASQSPADVTRACGSIPQTRPNALSPFATLPPAVRCDWVTDDDILTGVLYSRARRTGDFSKQALPLDGTRWLPHTPVPLHQHLPLTLGPPQAGLSAFLLAERRASAHSELSRRLKSRGHEVLARVTSAQGAIDYAGFLAPDVVLVSLVLEDAPGLTVAMAVAKKQPGVAAVVLTNHPAAADPASRPKWGSVALLPADAEADEIHEELWRAVMQARETSAAAELAPAAEIGRTSSRGRRTP